MQRQIAIVSHYMTRTHGQGRINLELAKALRQSGERVTAVATYLEPQCGVPWAQVPVWSKLPTHWARDQTFRWRAGRWLKNWSNAQAAPPLVITNGAAVDAGGDLNLAMFVHRAWHASRFHPRHDGSWYGKYLGQYNAFCARQEITAFRQARRIAALSAVVANELVEFLDIDPAKISVVPPGIDAHEFLPSSDPSEAGALRQLCGIRSPMGAPPLLVIFAGEIRSSRKNLLLVLKALAAVPQVHLAVAGATQGSASPRDAVSLGVAERTHFLGQRNDLHRLMRGADAFVFPSHYEPFGLVVTEAMASGLPVAVTRQTGAAMFVDDTCGFLLDDGNDLERLVAAIECWRDMPLERRQMGLASRQRVLAWTWQDMAIDYQKLIQNFCGPDP